MQGFQNIKGSARKRFIAFVAALLTFALITPAAAAMSLVAQAEPDEEEQAQVTAPIGGLSSTEIQFLEDNWYFAIDDLVEDDSEREAAPERYFGLSQDQILFLEDNWHFAIDDVVEEEAEQGRSVTDATILRNEIQFLEDNWYFAADDLGFSTDDDPVVEHLPMTRGEMYFIEQNTEFGLSPSGDSEDEEEDEGDDDSNDAGNSLTHPWGGDSTELDW